MGRVSLCYSILVIMAVVIAFWALCFLLSGVFSAVSTAILALGNSGLLPLLFLVLYLRRAFLRTAVARVVTKAQVSVRFLSNFLVSYGIEMIPDVQALDEAERSVYAGIGGDNSTDSENEMEVVPWLPGALCPLPIYVHILGAGDVLLEEPILLSARGSALGEEVRRRLEHTLLWTWRRGTVMAFELHVGMAGAMLLPSCQHEVRTPSLRVCRFTSPSHCISWVLSSLPLRSVPEIRIFVSPEHQLLTATLTFFPRWLYEQTFQISLDKLQPVRCKDDLFLLDRPGTKIVDSQFLQRSILPCRFPLQLVHADTGLAVVGCNVSYNGCETILEFDKENVADAALRLQVLSPFDSKHVLFDSGEAAKVSAVIFRSTIVLRFKAVFDEDGQLWFEHFTDGIPDFLPARLGPVLNVDRFLGINRVQG